MVKNMAGIFYHILTVSPPGSILNHSGSPCDPFQIRPAAIGFVESFELRSEELSGGLRPRRMGIHLESVNPQVWRKPWPWIVAWMPYDAIVDSNVSRVSESLVVWMWRIPSLEMVSICFSVAPFLHPGDTALRREPGTWTPAIAPQHSPSDGERRSCDFVRSESKWTSESMESQTWIGEQDGLAW